MAYDLTLGFSCCFFESRVLWYYFQGKYAHCGFPEAGYAKFAEILVCRGHKVARVEQTETPDDLETRRAREKSKDKVVRR